MNAIFDVGGVIVEWNPKEILAKLFPDESVRRNLIENVFYHPDWKLLDGGILTREQAAGRFAERSGVPRREIIALLERIAEFLTPKEDTRELLRELRAAGVGLYCMSNMPNENYEYFRKKYSLFDIFDGVVISSHVKLMKPDREIYDYAVATFGIVPTETVFVDDAPANVEAAAKLGFMTILFDNAENCRTSLLRLGVISRNQ